MFGHNYDSELKQIISLLQHSNATSDSILAEVIHIRRLLQVPVTMQLQFKGGKPGMPGTETDTQTIPCTALEKDAAGQPVTLNPANVTWSIDDPSIAQLTQNPDGSATFKALAVGSTNVHCTDNGTTPPLVGTDQLTVTAGAASSLILQFGTPS